MVHVFVGHHVEVEGAAAQDLPDVLDHGPEDVVAPALAAGGVAHVDEDVAGLRLAGAVAVGNRNQNRVAEANVVHAHAQRIHHNPLAM